MFSQDFRPVVPKIRSRPKSGSRGSDVGSRGFFVENYTITKIFMRRFIWSAFHKFLFTSKWF